MFFRRLSVSPNLSRMPIPQYACTQQRLGEVEIVLGESCHLPDNKHTQHTIDYLGMSSALIGEMIVQVVTWTRTFKTKRILREQNTNKRLGSLLLRDGATLWVPYR